MHRREARPRRPTRKRRRGRPAGRRPQGSAAARRGRGRAFNSPANRSAARPRPRSTAVAQDHPQHRDHRQGVVPRRRSFRDSRIERAITTTVPTSHRPERLDPDLPGTAWSAASPDRVRRRGQHRQPRSPAPTRALFAAAIARSTRANPIIWKHQSGRRDRQRAGLAPAAARPAGRDRPRDRQPRPRQARSSRGLVHSSSRRLAWEVAARSRTWCVRRSAIQADEPAGRARPCSSCGGV